MRINSNPTNYGLANYKTTVFMSAETQATPIRKSSKFAYGNKVLERPGWYMGSTDVLTLYGRDLRKSNPLTLEEEIDLGEQSFGKDDEKAVKARHKLIRRNLRFVVSIANEYKNGKVPVPDLIQAGNIGLVRAAKLYDPTRGFKFISYAVPFIRESIKAALLNDSRTVRLGWSVQQRNSAINKFRTKFYTEFGIFPTNEEIATALQLPENSVKSVLKQSQAISYLDAPIAMQEDSTRTLYDILPNNDDLPASNLDSDQQDMFDLIIRQIKRLPETEKNIITLMYGLDGSRVERSALEVSEILKIDEDEVKRIYELIKRKLRRYCKVKK